MITLLTEWLYIAAQMPHGTHAQQNVFRAVQRVGRIGSALGLPVRGAKRLAAELRDRGVGDAAPSEALPSEEHFDAVVSAEAERQRREQPAPEAAWPRPAYPAANVVSPSDPSQHALEAFAQVAENLGWREQSDRIVWPGSAVVIDDEEPEPRLLELLADLNPLRGGKGLPGG